MSRSPVDPDALLELVDRDLDLLGALVDAFLEECPEYLKALRTAVNEEDAEALAQEAHRLKGTVGNLRAEPAREVACQIERAGEAGDFEKADTILDRLECEMERLRTALLDLKEEYREGVSSGA